jgi:hypothetical protein
MELYYHVYQFMKNKGLKFRFYYYRNKSTYCICGNVDIELSNNISRIVHFDPEVDLRLSNEEKDGIVNTVLKYIYI